MSDEKRDDPDTERSAGLPSPSGPAADVVETVEARKLLGTRGLLRIEHEGELYTLRLTRNNRLILTK